MVGTIFQAMGTKVEDAALRRIISEVDADGNYSILFCFSSD